MAEARDRPPVAVILPFYDDADSADAVLAELRSLMTRAGDEIIVADNTDAGLFVERPGADAVTALACEVKRSAYAARNIGAEHATAPWLLFVDADCRLPADLLDRYFESPPADDVGAVAGQVTGVPDQPGFIPAYIRDRRHLDQEWLHEHHPYRPMAVTANLLVRREAWTALGGFAEHTRSGADADFSWRLQDAGWRLAYNSHAAVHHEHRATLRALLRQAERDGAANTWLARRHPGYQGLRSARVLPRNFAAMLAWLARGNPRRAAYAAVDALFTFAGDVGAFGTNAAPTGPRAPVGTVVLVDQFPAGDFAATTGSNVRVEAIRRPVAAPWTAARGVDVSFVEDDGPIARARAAARVLRRARAARPRRLSLGALAPAARRLAADEPAVVLSEPALLDEARALCILAGLPATIARPWNDAAPR